MRAVASLAAIPLTVCAGASLAQENPINTPVSPPAYGDIHVPPSEENLSAKEVREGMVKFARCVAGRRAKESHAFVLDQTGQSWSVIEKKIDDDCVLDAVQNPSGEVRVSTNNRDLLFALAEVLVQKRLAAYDPAQIPAAAPLGPDYSGASSIGECAVRANPQGARQLLRTRINSKEERQAVQALMPAFAGCIPAGVEVRPDLTTLRGNVAVYYYRLAHAPKSQAVTARNERGQ